MEKFTRSFATLCATLAVAACGQTPGDAEVREAVTAQMHALGGKQGADMFKDEVAKIKVIACKKAEPNGFRCDWTSPMGAASGRIVKSDAGWVLVNGG